MRLLPGQYFDDESGYHQNGFRDYDPTTGRYLQSDPLKYTGPANIPYQLLAKLPGVSDKDLANALEGTNGSINPYTYVDNNPLQWVDVTGKAKGKDKKTCGILRLAVVATCKAPTRCNNGDSCFALRVKIATKNLCILAQTALTNTCFPNNPSHKERIENERRGLERCQELHRGCAEC